jgi:hypothetical protein
MNAREITTQILDPIGCAANSFCVYAGVSEIRWSRACHGSKPLSEYESLQATKTAEELAGLAADAAPFPLSFRNIEIIRRLLEDRRQGTRWIPLSVGGKEVETAAK